MKPYYEHAGITIYHGDCREILPALDAVDCLITDPPYGVEFAGKMTKHSDRRGDLEVYDDTEAYFRDVVLSGVGLALGLCKRAAIFTGTRRLHEYPPATDIGGIVCPNGAGRSAWGFGCFHPVAFYGTSPFMQEGLGARPTARAIYHPGMHVTGESYEHPCQKPIEFMTWVVETASLPGQTILDPFAGTGTTLAAAKQLARRAIGIEIEEKYCEIAANRLSQEVFDFK
jgi:site-specific DNA-methyltransferase (adenine-specific)